MEAQGLPGQELYDLVVKTLAEAKMRQTKVYTTTGRPTSCGGPISFLMSNRAGC